MHFNLREGGKESTNVRTRTNKWQMYLPCIYLSLSAIRVHTRQMPKVVSESTFY